MSSGNQPQAFVCWGGAGFMGSASVQGFFLACVLISCFLRNKFYILGFIFALGIELVPLFA